MVTGAKTATRSSKIPAFRRRLHFKVEMNSLSFLADLFGPMNGTFLKSYTFTGRTATTPAVNIKSMAKRKWQKLFHSLFWRFIISMRSSSLSQYENAYLQLELKHYFPNFCGISIQFAAIVSQTLAFCSNFHKKNFIRYRLETSLDSKWLRTVNKEQKNQIKIDFKV